MAFQFADLWRVKHVVARAQIFEKYCIWRGSVVPRFSERSTLSCTDVSGGQFQKVRWYGPFGWKIVINSQLNEIFGPFPEFGSSFRGSQLLLLSISIEATTCNLRLKLMPTNDPIALVCVMQIKRIV
jgi:hypothetical protein